MRLRSALLVASLIVACLLAALVGPSAPQAVASGPNRAVVVADSGTGVIVRGIEFESETVTGLEALQLAGLSPVIQGFQGEGGAVCALNGVGCPSDGSCLTCDARGYYWAYHRAPAGSGAYSYSRVGAGATVVHDGDVEGWKWGTGAAPAYHSVDEVFPPAPVTTAPPSGGGTGGGNGSGGAPAPGPGPAAPGGQGPAGTGTPEAGEPDTTTSVVDPATTTSVAEAAGATTTSAPGAGTDDADEIAFQAAQSSRPDEGGSQRNTVASVALFLVTLGGIAALVVRSRRRRAA